MASELEIQPQPNNSSIISKIDDIQDFRNITVPNDTCNPSPSMSSNAASAIHFPEGWQSVLDTLILNLVLFVIFLIIFITLRNLAWGRKHLTSNRLSKGWLQSIYGDRKLTSKGLVSRDTSQVIHHKHDLHINVLMPPMVKSPNDSSQADVVSLSRSSPSINGGDSTVVFGCDPNHNNGARAENGFNNLPNNIQATIVGFGYRLRDVLLIRDVDILKNRGSDALQYLIFQEYIIYFLIILCIFSMSVVLPVNLQGGKSTYAQGYAFTTIANLPKKSPLYWVHVIGATVISLIGLIMMHRFSKVIKRDDERITRRTLLIRRVPKQKRNKELLTTYFRTSIPNCVIEGVQSVYDVRALSLLSNEMTNLRNARCYCVEYFESKGKLLKIRPRTFGKLGFLCACCECCKEVDGIQYYSTQEARFHQKINREFNRTILNPTGAFFVTFQTEKMAQEAYIHLLQQQESVFSFCPFANTLTQISTWCTRLIQIPTTDDLEISRWMVSYAPFPNDINWTDISHNLRMKWFRSSMVNTLLFIVFVFISTPAVILNASVQLQFLLPSNIVSKDLMSPFILICAASALPAIVSLACQSISYINISAKNHSIMWKVYLFLLLMVIVWPPLGQTASLYLFLKDEHRPSWYCLFPVNYGEFSVNYTIQYAFLGNIMELMRLPELLAYVWYVATARSQAECNTASRYVVWDFAIGLRYPRFLLIFAMVVTYSLSCPLISVAGLIYMIIKHMIDRYNIYYVYEPSKINSKIHSTAIIFVHIALLMMQAQIFIVTFAQTGYSKIFGFSLFVLLVSLLIFSGHFFFYVFTNINHLTYRATGKQSKSRREYCACSYLPPVLYNLTLHNLNSNEMPTNSGSQQQHQNENHLQTPRTSHSRKVSKVSKEMIETAGSDSRLSDDFADPGVLEIKIHHSGEGIDSKESEPLDSNNEQTHCR